MSSAFDSSNGGARSSRTGISRTDDFQPSSVTAAATIHKAIRDGEYAQLPDLVPVTHPELLWEANSTGWTAVHYAASHFLPVEWWEWILVRAVTCPGAAKKFKTCLTALGQSVVQIFLQSYLNPLPWQSIQVKNRSRFLRQGIKNVCASKALQNAVQAWIIHSRIAGGATGFFHRPVLTTQSQAVHLTVGFWTALELMARAVLHETLVYRSDLDILSFLASTGSCPKQVADLVLVFDKNAAANRSVTGSLPLHLWAESHTYYRDQDGMLGPLLHAYPEAAAVTDKDGRWPLYTALASGKSWASIRPLFEIFPHALHTVDCCTGLPAAATAACCLDQDSVEIRARQLSAGDKGLVSVWNLAPMARKQEALLQAAEELNTERLTTIYQIVRAFPQVLHVQS